MIDLRYARRRFLAALMTTVAGSVLAASAFSFTKMTERWLELSIGCAVLTMVAGAFAARGRGTAQRILDLPLVLVCAWAMTSSRVVESAGAGSSSAAVKWFSFSAGAAIAVLGLIGLLLHQRGMEKDLEWAASERQTSYDSVNDSECLSQIDRRLARVSGRSRDAETRTTGR